MEDLTLSCGRDDEVVCRGKELVPERSGSPSIASDYDSDDDRIKVSHVVMYTLSVTFFLLLA